MTSPYGYDNNNYDNISFFPTEKTRSHGGGREIKIVLGGKFIAFGYSMIFWTHGRNNALNVPPRMPPGVLGSAAARSFVLIILLLLRLLYCSYCVYITGTIGWRRTVAVGRFHFLMRTRRIDKFTTDCTGCHTGIYTSPVFLEINKLYFFYKHPWAAKIIW